MTEIKVGDTVRFVNNWMHRKHGEWVVGRIDEVGDFRAVGHEHEVIDGKWGSTKNIYDFVEVELVSRATPAFKVGDRVRVKPEPEQEWVTVPREGGWAMLKSGDRVRIKDEGIEAEFTLESTENPYMFKTGIMGLDYFHRSEVEGRWPFNTVEVLREKRKLPTEDGLYLGKSGTLFRLEEGEWTQTSAGSVVRNPEHRLTTDKHWPLTRLVEAE